MRMRAARDDAADKAFARLTAAARLADAHGSVALLRRCQRDLAAVPAACAPSAAVRRAG
jgi:hypothetical protein